MRSGNIPHTGGYARRSTVSNCTFSKGILIYNFRLNTNGVISTYFVQHCGTLADIFLLQYSTKLHLSLSLVLRQYLPHYYFFFHSRKGLKRIFSTGVLFLIFTSTLWFSSRTRILLSSPLYFGASGSSWRRFQTGGPVCFRLLPFFPWRMYTGLVCESLSDTYQPYHEAQVVYRLSYSQKTFGGNIRGRWEPKPSSGSLLWNPFHTNIWYSSIILSVQNYTVVLIFSKSLTLYTLSKGSPYPSIRWRRSFIYFFSLLSLSVLNHRCTHVRSDGDQDTTEHLYGAWISA